MLLALAVLAVPQEPASPGPVTKKPLPDESTYVEIVDVPLPTMSSSHFMEHA